jgi:sortase A
MMSTTISSQPSSVSVGRRYLGIVNLRRWLAFGLTGLAIGFAANAAWIPVKAELAQILLQRAWAKTLSGEAQSKPWPWADTWPVARLRVEEHGINLIVLGDATGRTLAFAPGHISGTAKPGAWGNCVLSGHRDTHFRFLRDILPGEVLSLQTPDGVVRNFRVNARHIVYENDIHILDDGGDTTLTLVTCYPFDAIVPGGPLRYIVQAELQAT